MLILLLLLKMLEKTKWNENAVRLSYSWPAEQTVTGSLIFRLTDSLLSLSFSFVTGGAGNGAVII